MEVSRGEDFYARKVENKDGSEQYQLLKEHLTNVAELASEFVGQFSDKNIGYAMGLLHDAGKYSEAFQQRIRGALVKVGHAKAGAVVCENLYEASEKNVFMYRLMGMAIMGHHNKLSDFGTVAQIGTYKMRISNVNDIEAYAADFATEITDIPQVPKDDSRMRIRRPLVSMNGQSNSYQQKVVIGFMAQLYGRMLFSCLVDADRIDAQNYPDSEASKIMNAHKSIPDLQIVFDRAMDKFQKAAKRTALNDIRTGIYRDCLTASQGEKGFFSLTVPTGGGKTLSSMAFALHHAVKHKQQRILYTIPFTSIIEQNAETFAAILGRENVLEHHCNFELPSYSQPDYSIDEMDQALKLKLAQENWHEPIVVTTNVQFFESLFSNKASKVRKLHHIANSVIVLDEVQSIPNSYIKPCLEALAELVENYGCTVVLCSATQPEFVANHLFLSAVNVKEIIHNVDDLFVALKRTKAVFLGEQSLTDISEKIKADQAALCIVNTKRHAKELFKQLAGEPNIYHLSTNMCPQHRKKVLAEIRNLLVAGEACKVISTQLIEAGVDIDFPVVYRAIAGIDSITQAAGRCNREGKQSFEQAPVYVFVPEEEYRGKGYLKITGQLGNQVINHQKNFLAHDAVRAYFVELFDFTKENLDKGRILQYCEEGLGNGDLRMPYQKINDNFKFIQNEGYPVIIRCDEKARKLLEELKYVPNIGGILRKLAPYTVNVKEYELERIRDQVNIDRENGVIVLINDALYSEAYGLDTQYVDEFDYIL